MYNAALRDAAQTLCNAALAGTPVQDLLIHHCLKIRVSFWHGRVCSFYKGKNTSEPDVMLKLGDVNLPAHRSLLAASSDYFKALFQASSQAISKGMPLSFGIVTWLYAVCHR